MPWVPFETGADLAAQLSAPGLSLEPRQWKRLLGFEHGHCRAPGAPLNPASCTRPIPPVVCISVPATLRATLAGLRP